ncbi:hypothetical protein C8F01DRAFT_1149674 [Mycena amicta]|nr:hypothetical protein C8F01DRAFT_1149674 [Mycena amicta]
MSTQVLAALLAARDARCNVDHVQKTASIPAIDNVFTLSCQVAYYAVDTLRCLATAREEDLWSIFGDVISRWTASAPASVMAEKVADERRWITQYRSSHPETDMTPILLKIRRCLCTVDLVYVPFTSVPALATRLSTEPSTLHKTLAFHHRADDKNTIYLSSFLPHLELLLQEGDLAPTTAFKTGFEMDVLVVSIAMAIIHESRHLVGTLVRVCSSPLC